MLFSIYNQKVVISVEVIQRGVRWIDPLSIHRKKYTNPARGILDFCKQKFFRPSFAATGPYSGTENVLNPEKPKNMYKLKKGPPSGGALNLAAYSG